MNQDRAGVRSAARVVRSKVDGSARGAEMESWLVALEFVGVEPEVVSKALRLLVGG